MRLLFHNYSNNVSTEPMYLNEAIRQCGIDTHMWSDPQVSAFDMLDKVKPDVIISSYKLITKDIMTYLTQSSIELVLNITGITNNQLKAVESSLKDCHIRCPFFFDNRFEYKDSWKVDAVDTKVHTIWPAADIFNIHPPKKPTLPECIISEKFDKTIENYIADRGPYHLLYLSDNDLIPPFDIRGNVASIAQLYKYYEQITFFGNTDFCSSQLFFDANLQSCRAKFFVPDEEIERWTNVLETCFNSSPITDDMSIQSMIKSQIKAKHTPFHRAWTLMKHLKNQEALRSIETVKSQLPTALKDV